jgi:hypothetical protein
MLVLICFESILIIPISRMILYDVQTRRCLNGAVSELTSVLVNSKLVLAGPVDPLLSWEKMHLGYLGWDRIEHLPGQPQK